MYFTTPLLKSVYFDQDVLLKLENTQPSGSFKSRGLTNLVATKAAEYDNPHVYASSGGNAGLAAVEAASELGIPATVVVPQSTKPRMLSRLRKLGAEVIVHGEVFSEANTYLTDTVIAEAEAKGAQAIYCHPYDNPLIWEGHSTMVTEMAEQIQKYGESMPSAIVLSAGGSGLYVGVMLGLEKVGWADKVPVIVVETEGAPTFHEALKAGKVVSLPKVQTVATSLGATTVVPEAVEFAKKYGTRSVLVSDEEALSAVYRFATDHDIIVEPACAATLAAVYRGDTKEFDKRYVVAIVCGGTSYGPEELQDAAKYREA